MPDFCVPLTRPEPDIDRMIDIILGRRSCDRVPVVDYIIDDVHVEAISGMLGRQWSAPPGAAYLDNFIACWYRLGYDYVRIERNAGFTTRSEAAADATMAQGQRGWVAHDGLINTWEDFGRYPWPVVSDEVFADIEYVNGHLPDGMGLISSHGGGVYEYLSAIMGYENLCLQLHDQPELVAAVAKRVGGIMVEFYQKLVQFDRLSVVWPGDDMGFRTATLINPEKLRELILPYHRRFAQIAHDAGKPYFLHSCGNLEVIMDDLIDDVKIDAKHSFEDVIIPVTDFQARYGERIGVLGGVDVDLLTTKPIDEIRRRTRQIIDTCAPRGRFAIGSGNSIPSYIPLENYLTMLDEALRV